MPVTRGTVTSSPRCCRSVAITADGSQFATSVTAVDYAPRVLIWDAKSCCVTRAIPIGTSSGHLAFAPDGTSVAADYYGKDRLQGRTPGHVLGVWDPSSGTEFLAGRPFDLEFTDLVYTRDSRYLLAIGRHMSPPDGGNVAVGVWDAKTGKLVNRISPVTNTISALPGAHMAVSPDNKLLAVPGPEITIYAIEYAEQPKPKAE